MQMNRNMLSALAWYQRVALIWVGALAAGLACSYALARTALPSVAVNVLEIALWAFIGAALYGRWSYTSYRRQQARPDAESQAGNSQPRAIP